MQNKIKYLSLLLTMFLLLIGCQNRQADITNPSIYLSALTLSSGTLSPTFNSTTATYNVSVSNSASTITLTPTSTGIIKVNDNTVLSGTASNPISLSIGTNTITIKVSLQENSTPNIYTITVIRENSGNVFYVSTNGSDTTGSGSQNNPWATPGYGSRQLNAGDTLIILRGNYTLTRYDEDIITPQNSGTSSSPIIIRGETGNRPVLMARNTSVSGSNLGLGTMVNLSGKSYINIENIEFTHDSTVTGTQTYVRDCILINGQPADNIKFIDLYIHHIDQFGINIQDVNYMTVKNCTIEYCGFGAMGGPDAGAGGGWKNVVIDSCGLSYNGHYYQGTNSSAQIYDRPDGIGLEESKGPVEIKNCTVEHNRGDGIDLKVESSYVHENIVANNSCDGIKLWGSSRVHNCLIYGTGDGTGGASPWANIVVGTEDTSDIIEIINCTIHDNPSREAYSVYMQYDERKNITIIMKNNIVFNSQGLIWIAPEVTNYTIENNLFYRYNSSDQIYLRGTNHTINSLNLLTNCKNNISNDPKFLSPAWGSSGNYHLQTDSPAINAGTSAGAPSIDLANISRPKGTLTDIGAYEDY